MKYILALGACFGIFVVYAIIAGVMGWKHGGGAIPMLILFAAIVGTWRAITKTSDQSNDQYSSPIKMQTSNKNNDGVGHETSANESYLSTLNTQSNIIFEKELIDPVNVLSHEAVSKNEVSMNNNANLMGINEDELYLQATQEIDKSNQDQALRTKCSVLGEGDEGKAKYKYSKERVDRLRDVKVKEIEEEIFRKQEIERVKKIEEQKKIEEENKKLIDNALINQIEEYYDLQKKLKKNNIKFFRNNYGTYYLTDKLNKEHIFHTKEDLCLYILADKDLRIKIL